MYSQGFVWPVVTQTIKNNPKIGFHSFGLLVEGTDCVVSAKEDNDKEDLSPHQTKRIKLFDEKRNDIFDQARRNSLTKELGKFYNSIA